MVSNEREPISRILSWRDIYLCGLPEGIERVHSPAPSYLALLQPGFAEPARSPEPLVVSCTTVSPLPDRASGGSPSAVCSLWHFPEVAPAELSSVACPVESGLSSSVFDHGPDTDASLWLSLDGRVYRIGGATREVGEDDAGQSSREKSSTNRMREQCSHVTIERLPLARSTVLPASFSLQPAQVPFLIIAMGSAPRARNVSYCWIR